MLNMIMHVVVNMLLYVLQICWTTDVVLFLRGVIYGISAVLNYISKCTFTFLSDTILEHLLASGNRSNYIKSAQFEASFFVIQIIIIMYIKVNILI